MKSIGIIGLGKMGKCLVQGLIDASLVAKEAVFFTTRHPETALRASEELGLPSVATNAELVKRSEVVVLAVKPQNTAEVLNEIAPFLTPKHLILSVVASISTHQIENRCKGPVPVIRAMPNVPALIRAGITAYCLGQHAKAEHAALAKQIFASVGQSAEVDERHMNAVTGLSGCGPAYIYVVLESLTDAGIKVGLPRDLATQLAAHTVLGSARMLLETGRHPASLKDDVTTPAGCTIDGLMELEEGKLRVTLIKAVVQATERARDLAKQTEID